MCKQLNRRTHTQYNRVQRSEKPLHLCSMWLQITVLKIKAPPEGIVCLLDDTFQCLSFSQRLKDTSKADQAAAVLCYNRTLQWTFNYLITIVIIIFYMPSATMCSLSIIPALSHVYMHVRMQNSGCSRTSELQYKHGVVNCVTVSVQRNLKALLCFTLFIFSYFQWNGGVFFSSSREIRKSLHCLFLDWNSLATWTIERETQLMLFIFFFFPDGHAMLTDALGIPNTLISL